MECIVRQIYIHWFCLMFLNCRTKISLLFMAFLSSSVVLIGCSKVLVNQTSLLFQPSFSSLLRTGFLPFPYFRYYQHYQLQHAMHQKHYHILIFYINRLKISCYHRLMLLFIFCMEFIIMVYEMLLQPNDIGSTQSLFVQMD